MERMIILTEKDYQELIDKYTALEEENKKLNEEIENHKQNIMQDELEIIPKLEEENRKLKEELKWWKDLVHKAKEFEYDEDGMDYIYQNTENL